MTMRLCRRLLLAAIAAMALPAAADQEADASPTLRKIREQGVVYLGYREAAVPFSYVDAQGEVRGYSWELCQKVVDAVRDKLRLPELRVVPVPVTVSNRMLMVRNGTVDLECSATADMPSRQRQVAFSRSIYVAGIKALVKSESPIRSLADLDGKRVVTTLGSGAERYVKTASALRSATIAYVSGDSHAASLQAVADGKADAFVLDDASLAELRAASDPAAYRLLEDNLAIEPYGIVLSRDDAAFKQVVDGALGALMKGGELERIYERWFLSPLPVLGFRLDLPMSNMLKEMVRTAGLN